MRRLLLIPVLMWPLLLAGSSAAETEPIAPAWVEACPANTTPVDGQAWWMPEEGHVHIGFCAPYGQTLSGTLNLTVHTILHDNPGTLHKLQISTDVAGVGMSTLALGRTCPNPGTCHWTDVLTWDTSELPFDGWHQLRVRAVVNQSNGKQLLASNHIDVLLDNGHPLQNYPATVDGEKAYAAGKGWYTNEDYVWSTIFAPPTAGETHTGVVEFRMRTNRTAGEEPVSRLIVKLDATHDDPGTVLHDGGAANQQLTVRVDTSALADGWHSIGARADTVIGPDTMSGHTKIWFRVDHPEPQPTPTLAPCGG